MGLGDDYNEDLMQAMAEAGDGNYYFIEAPEQLADIFHTEMKGLMANLGRRSASAWSPGRARRWRRSSTTWTATRSAGSCCPTSWWGCRSRSFRLKVPPMAAEREVCRVRLAWDDPTSGGRRSMAQALALRRRARRRRGRRLPVDPIVAEQVAIQMAARAKKEAMAAYDRGDMA